MTGSMLEDLAGPMGRPAPVYIVGTKVILNPWRELALDQAVAMDGATKVMASVCAKVEALEAERDRWQAVAQRFEAELRDIERQLRDRGYVLVWPSSRESAIPTFTARCPAI